jgi:hypothetical protein
MKIVAVWTMCDEHGEIEIRDWSGATYQDSDYTDKSVRIKRVRVSSTTNSSIKSAEFKVHDSPTCVTDEVVAGRQTQPCKLTPATIVPASYSCSREINFIHADT